MAAGALLGPVLVAASFFLVALVAAPLGSALASAWMASGSWGAAGSGSAQEALTFFVFQAVEWVFVPLALIWGSGLWLLRWAAAWMTRGPLAATLGDPSRRISLALGVGLGISAGVCWVVAPLLGSGGSVETLLPAAWVCLVGIGSLAAILRAPAWWGGVPRPAWSWALRAYAGASGASVQAALVLTWLNLARHQSLVDVEILQAATLLVPGTLAATLVALGLRRGAEERERRDLAWGAPWGLTGGLLIMAMFWTAKLQWKIEGQAAFVANLTLPLVAAGHAWWIRRLLLGRDPERAGPPR